MNTLAIIVPAYKPNFLRSTLTSIANQENQNFHCYIFDDASPFNLEEVSKEFTVLSNFTYHRFSENWGGTQLANHWNRCIDLTSETMIWLFSDDDTMSADCTECLFQAWALKDPNHHSIYRFQNEVIDHFGKPIRNSSHPTYQTSKEFLKGRLNYRFDSFVTDYVFTRHVYTKANKFINFPCAWCSDDAFWYACTATTQSSIYTLSSGKIQWRYSGLNISSSTTLNAAKIEATDNYVKWLWTVQKINFGMRLRTLKWQVRMYTLLGLAPTQAEKVQRDFVSQLFFRSPLTVCIYYMVTPVVNVAVKIYRKIKKLTVDKQ